MKNKRLHALPRLTQKEKAKFLAVLMHAIEDFEIGLMRMREMSKISDDEWIKNNGIYYKNAKGGMLYLMERLKIQPTFEQ